MARFINTRKAVSEIEELIKNAGEKLILVSPYLRLSKDFKELLNYRNGKDKVTTIVFGKQELNPDEMKFLQTLRFVVLRYNEDLHAKCYLDDTKMIITSMNLYEFSMANNKEMGVLIDRNDEADVKLFDDAVKEVEYIIQTSQRFELGDLPRPRVQSATITNEKRQNSLPNRKGFCIRTGVAIPFDIERPFSYDAYLIWNQYGDVFYPEKFCHFSGEPSNGETSFNKPIMSRNWKKAKEVFEF
jgi:phosphatidylserine/phosphatidylglycerophosphate/cardiolipin synthase-like enzyme